MKHTVKLSLRAACALVVVVLMPAHSTAQNTIVSSKPKDTSSIQQPEHVRFATQDGGTICADLYGSGERGLVLAHGGRFNKESWEKQARELTRAGFRVLAINFRGY